jgi:hypothetical protein
MTQKEILVQRLSTLLGFEDGATDVLEHLLSIESSDVRWQERLSIRVSTHSHSMSSRSFIFPRTWLITCHNSWDEMTKNFIHLCKMLADIIRERS